MSKPEPKTQQKPKQPTEIERARAEATEYLEGWQRAKAELDNFKKQAVADRAVERERVLADTLLPLLSLADNFGAMAEQVPQELADNAWAQGVVHVAKQLEALLHDYGVTEMAAIKQTFDPHLHEAVDHVSGSKAKTGTNVEVVQAGYLIGDKVLRPAKVKVAT